MKILIMNDFLLMGGAEIYTLNLFELLKKRGHEVFLITFDKEFNDKIKKIDIDSGKIFNFTVKSKLSKMMFNKALYKELRKKIEEINPDKIIVNNFFSSPFTQYKALKRYECYQVVHDSHFICPKSECIDSKYNICSGYKNEKCINKCTYHNSKLKLIIKLYQTKKLEKLRKKYIRRFICPSEWLTQYLNENDYNTITINNPINTKEIENKEFIRKKVKGMKKKIIYVGWINNAKGIFKFLEIFDEFTKNNEEIELTIVGKCQSEEDKNKLKKYVINEQIKYLGEKTNREVLELLKETQFIIVPSIWMENYPTTVLEGMISGNLILGSNRGGISNMLSNNRGILFDIIDPKSVISALDRICKMDNNEYLEIVENAFNYTMENNSYDMYYKKLIGVIKNV